MQLKRLFPSSLSRAQLVGGMFQKGEIKSQDIVIELPMIPDQHLGFCRYTKMLLYFWIVNFNSCRQLKAANFFYQPFGDLDDTSEWPQSISLWKRNHTENITITLDFLTGSLCQEEEEEDGDWKD